MSSSGAHLGPSLASSADDVAWGLPVEYQLAVPTALEQAPLPVTVSEAAYGLIGSSHHVFAGLARLLDRVLAVGLPAEDEDVWHLRDKCWQDR